MDVISMPGLRSADSYRTWADLRDVLFEIVSATTLEQFSECCFLLSFPSPRDWFKKKQILIRSSNQIPKLYQPRLGHTHFPALGVVTFVFF